MANSIPLKGDGDKRIGAEFAPLSVKAQDIPNLTAKIRAGSFWNLNDEVVEFAGGNTPTIPAPSSLSRWSLVSISGTGSIVITHGATSATPMIPAAPAGCLALAAVNMSSSSTAITDVMIQDVRPYLQVVENVADLSTQLSDRPTFTDVDNLMDNKADLDGTPSTTFTLHKGMSGAATSSIIVARGSLPNVSIRWSESATRWEFTNDGTIWAPIASTSGTFMPVVPSAIVDHIATFDGSGVVQDSGTLLSNLATTTSVNAKATKVVGAITGHFASLNSSGDLVDSGFVGADFATQVDLATKADDADVVHLTGSETIDGTKTFTDNITVAPISGMPISVRSGPSDAGFTVSRMGGDAIFEWDESSQSWQAGIIGSAGSLITAAPQSPNTFYAGPMAGGNAMPTFRSLVVADLPISGSGSGSFGSSTTVGTFTVNSHGILTAAGAAAIAFPVTSVAGKTGVVTLVKADITNFNDADYAAAVHTHVAADITNFNVAVDGRISSAVGSTVQGHSLFLDNLDLLPSGGIVVRAGVSANTITITGTTNQITVFNGNGTGGNPTVALANNPVLPGSFFVPPTSATEPVGVPAGSMYFDTATNKHRAFDGTVWHDLY